MMNLKEWTWSEIVEQMSGFWPAGHELPSEILSESEFERKTRISFSAGPDELFAPFKISQPQVWERLMAFNDLQVVQNKKYPVLVDIAMSANNLAFFIEPFAYSDDEEYWQEIMQYMPGFLHCYYTNFNGMRGSRFTPFSPGNLPANNRKWQRISDYSKEEKVEKKLLKRLKGEFSSIDELFIFLKTDWGDLIFLDFNQPSKKIYVIPEGRFNEYFELNDPAYVIDSLCSHVLSGATEEFPLEKFRSAMQ